MDNVVNTNEVEIDYTLIYKDKNNILNDIGFTDDNDRLICDAIITSLECQAAENIKLGNTISIPFVGTIEKNWYKAAIKENYQDFRDYKATHTKEEYDEYFKSKCEEFKNDHAELEEKYKREKRFKKHLLPKYNNKVKNRGVVYANTWLKSIKLMEVVEFDPDIEDIYERFGTGLDADN